MTDSIYQRIGGAAAIKATVDKLYEKILSDPLLIPFFEGVDMEGQHRSQTAFVSMAVGGPIQYSGESMRKAHEKLVTEKGLSDEHFDAVAGHLQISLQELDVPAGLIGEVMAVVGTTRDDVLNK